MHVSPGSYIKPPPANAGQTAAANEIAQLKEDIVTCQSLDVYHNRDADGHAGVIKALRQKYDRVRELFELYPELKAEFGGPKVRSTLNAKHV